MSITVMGLGKLGAPLAATISAYGGHQVVGIDRDDKAVYAVLRREPHIIEPFYHEMLLKANISAVSTIHPEKAIEAIKASDITFVIVPTPSNFDGSFSLDFINSACDLIAHALREKDAYHLVVITSTVSPGSMVQIKNRLEEWSDKVCDVAFGLCYNPEFIALGTVVRDLIHPDFILIGESDERAGETLMQFYSTWVKSSQFKCMNFINAELTKIAVNTFITSKIAFANTLAMICESLPDADCHVITDAMGYDPRIGHRYLRGGLPYAGPCFPRDNSALIQFAESRNIYPTLFHAVDKANGERNEFILQRLISLDPKTVGILGLTYKPKTSVQDAAIGPMLARALHVRRGLPVKTWDPSVMNNTTILDILEWADTIVVATPWNEFYDIDFASFVNRGGKVFDLCDVVNPRLPNVYQLAKSWERECASS